MQSKDQTAPRSSSLPLFNAAVILIVFCAVDYVHGVAYALRITNNIAS